MIMTTPENTPGNSPEHRQAFNDVMTFLHEAPFDSEIDKKIVGRLAIGFITVHTDPDPFTYSDSTHNATSRIRSIHDTDYNSYRWRTLVLDEEIAEDVNCLATIDIEQGFGSHPAHLYHVYPNGTIEHWYRKEEHDGIDEEGYELNWREVIEPRGFLDVDQMQELLKTLQNVDGYISPEIALDPEIRKQLSLDTVVTVAKLWPEVDSDALGSERITDAIEEDVEKTFGDPYFFEDFLKLDDDDPRNN